MGGFVVVWLCILYLSSPQFYVDKVYVIDLEKR